MSQTRKSWALIRGEVHWQSPSGFRQICVFSAVMVPRVIIIIICESYRSRAQQTQPDYSSLLFRLKVVWRWERFWQRV